MITVPRGKLQHNYNLVYDALETSRLEESVNKLNENDGIMVVRIKTIKQFDNMVQDLLPGCAHECGSAGAQRH